MCIVDTLKAYVAIKIILKKLLSLKCAISDLNWNKWQSPIKKNEKLNLKEKKKPLTQKINP